MTMHRKLKVGLFFMAFVSVLFLLGQSPSVGAVSYELPDSNGFTTPGGGPPNWYVTLEISQPGSGIALNAPESWGKMYYTPAAPPLRMQILDGDFSNCGSNQYDSQGSGASGCFDAGAVNYEFYFGDAATNGSTPEPWPFMTINSSSLANNIWNDFGVPTPPSGPLDTGAGFRYVIYTRAVWTTGGPAEGRINGFKIASKSCCGTASYWSGGGGYAVQDRVNATNTEIDFTFEFAPPCNAPGSQTALLRWNDADAASNGGLPADGAQFPGDTQIRFELFEADPGGGGAVLIRNIDAGTAPNIGGNGQYRDISFTARSDKVYIWKWYKVNRNNGVQMWVPFDSFYYDKQCNPPPPVITTQCINGVVTANVNWTDGGLGSTPYYVDFDSDNDWNNNGFWNKPIPAGVFTTPAPNSFTGQLGKPPTMVLNRGSKYWVRVWYQNYARHSATAEFVAPICWGFTASGSTTASLDPDTENPTSAIFDNRVTLTFNPDPGGPAPPAGVNLTTTRKYFRVPLGAPPGTEIPMPTGPSPPNPRTNLFPPGTTVFSPPDSSTMPVVTAGDKICSRLTLTPTSGTVHPDGSITFASTAPPVVSCETITNKPYFRVYGGDVLAGLPEFNSVGCSASTPGSRILGFAKDDGSGAATQLAAQAMSKIEEFSSAAGRAGPASPTEPTPPKGLTFANAGDPADAGSTYGGGFRDSRCPNPNYFGTSGPAPIITGPYSHPGAVIPAAATPTKVFVDGDVFIDANITYAAGPWTAPNIPSFYLIAKGNIYIDKDVTQLDGVYVAQPDAADARGNIYTCAKWTGITGALPDLDGTFMSECDGNPVPAALTVNGSFIARSIKLLRTNGSLRASIPTETATDPSIAEVFSFSPEMWLAAPLPTITDTAVKYDAISSMPPVL